MAAVNFTIIPCERTVAHKEQGKPHFFSICPCDVDILQLSLMDSERYCTFFRVFFSFRVLTITGKYSSHHLFPTAERTLTTLMKLR